MTKAEIIAELRRSAREDVDPWFDMHVGAFWSALEWYGCNCGCKDPEVERLFFLILAHVLEDE